MLIPKYWAQYKQRFETSIGAHSSSSLNKDPSKKSQATIKRYGWSDVSQSEALAHAKQRVAEAHERWLAGEEIMRHEPRETYNQRSGIPIREQIIAEQTFELKDAAKNKSVPTTKLIVTRNSYGAQVANVSNIAIIDIDEDDLLCQYYPKSYISDGFMGVTNISKNGSSTLKVQLWGFVIGAIILAIIIAMQSLSWLWLLLFLGVATAVLWWQAERNTKAKYRKYKEDIASLEPRVIESITSRVNSNPNEAFRLYKTPAGFRAIAIHAVVNPDDTVVKQWFSDFQADENYVRLCQIQHCFRARLTAKPWRMKQAEEANFDRDIPVKDIWFINEREDLSTQEKQDLLSARKQWLADYDRFAKGYQACAYIETVEGRTYSYSNSQSNSHSGGEEVQAVINDFVKWHDRACQVDKALPMA